MKVGGGGGQTDRVGTRVDHPVVHRGAPAGEGIVRQLARAGSLGPGTGSSLVKPASSFTGRGTTPRTDTTYICTASLPERSAVLVTGSSTFKSVPVPLIDRRSDQLEGEARGVLQQRSCL